MSRFDDIYPLFPEYDMFAQTIDVLKAPNVYKVMTPYGSYVCKRTSASPGRLAFVAGLLRNLQQRGWDGAVPLAYTKYDEPYVQRDEQYYYLTGWRPSAAIGEEQIPVWGRATLVRLAELHHLTQNYRFDDPRQVDPLVDSLLARWEKWLGLMEKNAAIARARSYPSPFDTVFLANQAYLTEAATTAISSLRRWGEQHRTYAHFRLSLVHGAPYPAHTLLDSSGNVQFINFDRAVFDTPARDVSKFYRAYFHLGGEGTTASELFSAYQAVFPWRPEEVNLLMVFLSFPERIMGDLELYYRHAREWSELYAVRRLEKDLDRYMRMQRWMQQAF
ncbi:hypothetical protein [Brevibacillus massiliensis]|uniref:hypothetical protein n=1 Tax=Brevibacillus massiliensis TaxID=1118054 RepID=UPI0002DEDC48|nr:hypothetical protein [Brevibacillus massiliensis]